MGSIADITIAVSRLKQAFDGAAEATKNMFLLEAITRREDACSIADLNECPFGRARHTSRHCLWFGGC